MDIQWLIDTKEAAIAKLQSQVDLLHELARELRFPGHKRSQPKAAAGREGRLTHSPRAGHGTNQSKVLSLLTDTPQRASDIARSVGLTQQATTQSLNALIRKGVAEKTGRGQYKATAVTATNGSHIGSGAETVVPPVPRSAPRALGRNGPRAPLKLGGRRKK
jgi:hypothetical protein